ncbi:MAG: carbohydrate ABC transporter permease [Pseudomonadota bacterium]
MSLFTPRRIGQMSLGGSLITYALLLAWAAFVIFPIYWLVITSFKSISDVNAGPVYLPFIDFQPSLHAWKDLLIEDWDDTRRAYVNSIIIALCSTALSVLVGSMAAYALVRVTYAPRFSTILLFVLSLGGALAASLAYGVDWRLAGAVAVAIFVLAVRGLGNRFAATLGNGDILFWMISQRILAPVVVVVPIYMMFQSVGLLDTRTAIIVTYAVINLPIVVWLMFDFFNSIPRDLEESAQLDGATMFTVFREVVLPLSKPGLAATTLLVMILAWNEYLLALFLSTADAQTMPILVAAMNAGERGILWWTMSAVIVVMILPVLVLAIVLQRFISKGILVGAVKG